MKYLHCLLRGLILGLIAGHVAYYMGYRETVDALILSIETSSTYHTLHSWHDALEAIHPMLSMGVFAILPFFVGLSGIWILIYASVKVSRTWKRLMAKYKGRMDEEQWKLFFARRAADGVYYKESTICSSTNGVLYVWTDWVIALAPFLLAVLLMIFDPQVIGTYKQAQMGNVVKAMWTCALLLFSVSLMFMGMAVRMLQFPCLPHSVVDQYLEEQRHLDFTPCSIDRASSIMNNPKTLRVIYAVWAIVTLLRLAQFYSQQSG